MGPTSDRTVTDVFALSPPEPGEVVGARYEVRHRLQADPFAWGLLAFDRETSESVLLRILRPELLEPAVAIEVCRRLQQAVGIGGKYLPELRDANRHGRWVYTVENLPEGVPLQDVWEGRRRSGQRATAEELLPLVAHLDAALRAIPEGLYHGDVRPEQVWIDAHRFELKGPFVLPALPSGVVAAALRRHAERRRRVAPEVVSGGGGPASDRYAVAALVYEALTLEPPTADVPTTLGPLAGPLRDLLDRDPERRPASLEPLIEALARVAGLEPPDLEPAPTWRRPLASAGDASNNAPARMPSMDPDSAEGERAVPGTDPELDPRGLDLSPPEEPTAVAPPPLAPSLSDRATAVAPPPIAPSLSDRATAVAPPPIAPPPSDHDRATAVAPPPVAPRPSDHDRAVAAPPVAPGLTDDETAVAPLPLAPESAANSSGAHDDLATTRMQALGAEEAAAILAARAPSARDSGERRVPSDPAIPAAPDEESSLDPRLVRMARAADRAKPRARRFPSDPGLPATEGDEESSLDPRLVRAALGLTLEESDPAVPRDPAMPATPRADGTRELALGEVEFVADSEDDVPLDPSVEVQPRPDGTQELALDELDALEEAPARETHGTDQISLEDLEQMAAEHRRAAVPTGVKPLPRPRRDSGLGLPPAAPLFDDSSGPRSVAPGREVSVPVVASAAMQPTPAPAPAQRAPRAPATGPTTHATRPPGRRRRVGLTVVVVAMLLGVGIIVGSFLYARHRRARADEERREQLQQRIEELRARGE